MFGLDPLPRSLEAALRDVRHPKTGVRASAVRDLSRLAGDDDGGRATTALVEALSRDVSAEVRAAAAVALADAGSRTAVDALLDAVEDSHLSVRQMALLAIGELAEGDDERVREVVERAVEAEAPSLRFQGIIASQRLGTPGAESVLLRATRDADAQVRHVAYRLLEERASTDGDELRPSDEALAAAREGIEDAVPSVRLAAAILLARSGDRSGHAVLVEAVTRPRQRIEADDEQAAIALAGELGLAEARLGLVKRAWGGFFGRDRFAYEARIALARMGDARARAAILRDLQAWSRDARTLAVIAAGRARIAEARPAILAMRGDDRRAPPEAVDEALSLLG